MVDTWTTPPTFSYNYPASVDDMNIIRRDLLYLYGQMFSTTAAAQETEVEAESPYDDPSENPQIVYVGWIEHHEDNLYYRVRCRSDVSGHNLKLYVRYVGTPYGDYSVDGMGSHTEGPTTVGTSAVIFTNSDAAVDISGWGLTYGDLYRVEVLIGATNQDNQDAYGEVNFIYEMA